MPDENKHRLTAHGSKRLETKIAAGCGEPGAKPERWTKALLAEKANLTPNTVVTIRNKWSKDTTVRLASIRSIFSAVGLELQPDDTDPPNAQVPLEERLKPVREAFLKYVWYECKDLNPRGIPQTIKTVTVPLDEVYVSLTAERDTQRQEDERGGRQEDEQTGFATAEHDARRLVLQKEAKVQKVSLPQALQSSRLAILGVPGSGKTTLTRFLATTFARACLNDEARAHDREGNDYGAARLPIRIRIAEYANAFRATPGLSLEEFLPLAFKEVRQPQEALAELFKLTLDHGNAFMLLDGLDEVADAGHRREIANRIDRFVQGLGPQNRVLVTSCIVGYQQAQLGNAFTICRLQEMDRKQIERFLRSWCVAVERFQTLDAGQDAWQRKGNAEAEAILQAADTNPGVQRLATNPLLLTVLALIHRNGARIPARRIELYKLAADTLLRDWRLHQAGSEAHTVAVWEEEEFLGPLAYWLHSATETGQIPESAVREKLRELRGTAPGKPTTHDVRRDVDDFLRRVREHTGLFVEQAQGMYGFMHLTFEEYFAACDMVSFSIEAAARIYPHRHDPRWEEPIRLAIALKGQKDATYLIRTAILAQGDVAQTARYTPSRYNEFLRRDLLLAAHCIGDCAGVEPSLAYEVAEELVAICLKQDGKGTFKPLVEQALDTLQAVCDSPVGTAAVTMLVDVFKGNDWQAHQSAANVLGRVGKGSREVLEVLLTALKNKRGWVRKAAVGALGSVGVGIPEVRTALLTALRDPDWAVRSAAAGALASLGAGEVEVLRALLAVFSHEYWNLMEHNMSQALGRLGAGSAEALMDLLTVFKAENWEVWRAAGVLGMAGVETTEIRTALLVALQDKDAWVRAVAAGALKTVGVGSGEALSALLTLLKDDDWEVRRATMSALGSVGVGSAETLSALLTALNDANSSVRAAAAQALGNVGVGSGAALTSLLVALKDEDVWVREAASGALGSVGLGSAEALSALLGARKDNGWHVQKAAAGALAKVGAGSEEALTALLPVLQAEFRNEDWGAEFAAALLGSVGVGSARALKALLSALNNEEQYVRTVAAGALGSVGMGSEAALAALLAALKDEAWGVRAMAARALRRVAMGSTAAQVALLAALNDQAADVRDAAWESLWALTEL